MYEQVYSLSEQVRLYQNTTSSKTLFVFIILFSKKLKTRGRLHIIIGWRVFHVHSDLFSQSLSIIVYHIKIIYLFHQQTQTMNNKLYKKHYYK